MTSPVSSDGLIEVTPTDELLADAYKRGWREGCETLIEDAQDGAPIVMPHKDAMGEGCGNFLAEYYTRASTDTPKPAETLPLTVPKADGYGRATGEFVQAGTIQVEADTPKPVSDDLKKTKRALRYFSSSALEELRPSDLQEWAGASRQAIELLADTDTLLRYREALERAVLGFEKHARLWRENAERTALIEDKLRAENADAFAAEMVAALKSGDK